MIYINSWSSCELLFRQAVFTSKCFQFIIGSFLDEQGLSFATPEVPTEENFDSLFGPFLGFFGRSSVTSARQSPDVGNSSGYQVKFLNIW